MMTMDTTRLISVLSYWYFEMDNCQTDFQDLNEMKTYRIDKNLNKRLVSYSNRYCQESWAAYDTQVIQSYIKLLQKPVFSLKKNSRIRLGFRRNLCGQIPQQIQPDFVGTWHLNSGSELIYQQIMSFDKCVGYFFVKRKNILGIRKK